MQTLYLVHHLRFATWDSLAVISSNKIEFVEYNSIEMHFVSMKCNISNFQFERQQRSTGREHRGPFERKVVSQNSRFLNCILFRIWRSREFDLLDTITLVHLNYNRPISLISRSGFAIAGLQSWVKSEYQATRLSWGSQFWPSIETLNSNSQSRLNRDSQSRVTQAGLLA